MALLWTAALLGVSIGSATESMAQVATPLTTLPAAVSAASPASAPVTRLPNVERVQAPTEVSVQPAAESPPRNRSETRTRHATYRRVGFGELPGWEQDDLLESWPAFLRSCAALQRREPWRELCAQAASVPRTPAGIRAFFMSRFELLRILNTDASRDGEITGYFEPLLEGRRQADETFNVPVLGVPRDLYTLDWMRVPASRRGGIVDVRPIGNALEVLSSAETGSAPLDLRRFVLDTKDRRLRIRLSRVGLDWRADPYPSRGELLDLGLPGGVDAPVLAWVNDPLALYAMQIQGSGRIRMADSTVLRVQYADQNGHPFKPFRVVTRPRGQDGVVTRSIGGSSTDADEFELDDEEGLDPGDRRDAVGPDTGGDPPHDAVITRGLSNRKPRSADSGAKAAADALVEELLRGGRRPAPAASGPTRPGEIATVPASAKKPASVPQPLAVNANARQTFQASRLSSDPSYVFFKIAPDQASVGGPPGALGVPLTPGRSVAVDPRVTPLGYPVFLSAPAPQGSNIDMRRLVFAQDTGGAIRGAVRADFFWGFGSDAGRLARGTRHRGEMWLMMPRDEAARLGGGDIVTRSVAKGAGTNPECLIADDAFCLEPD